jgi:hypothetical protein
VKPRLSAVFTLALALLVVATQLEGAMHALTHIGDALGHTRNHSLLADQERCAECALLAASSNAIGGSEARAAIPATADERPQFKPASFVPAFASHYQSRAPPSLL